VNHTVCRKRITYQTEHVGTTKLKTVIVYTLYQCCILSQSSDRNLYISGTDSHY